MVVIMAIYLGCALIGGWADGKIFTSSTEAGVEGVAQTYALLENPFSGTGWNPIAWFNAGKNYLACWAGILTLNFSMFQGSAQIVRWGLLTMVSVPVMWKILTAFMR